MKFGVSLYPYYAFPDLPSIARFVRQAEVLRFDYVCVPEHVAFPKEHEHHMGITWWEAIVLASHLASITSTIRYMFCVLVVPQHNPFYLAKELATLDHVSQGRIDVGIGAGWLEGEFKLLGADFRRRGALTDEYLKILKVLWTEENPSFRGQYFSFDDVSFQPKPVQRPHPPIFVGGGLKASVPRAAALGDGWLPMCSAKEFKIGLTALREALAERRRPVDGFPVVGALPYVALSSQAQEHYRAAGGSGRGDFEGDAERSLSFIAEREELGVTHLTVQLPTDNFDRTMEALERFSSEVLSKCKR